MRQRFTLLGTLSPLFVPASFVGCRSPDCKEGDTL